MYILLINYFLPGFFPDVPNYAFDEKFDNFAFNSLLTREESIVALGKVITECNKVSAMSVFQVPVTKSMKLEEFEQSQAQVSSQVCHNIIFCFFNRYLYRLLSISLCDLCKSYQVIVSFLITECH